jgi:purine-binding chemotaxis protein CheW
MAQDNKFLTFRLGEECYAIPILKIKEIIGMMAITKIPKLPKFIKGVINLRGKIIPVVDLRIKFGLEEKQYDERTSIIVMEIQTESTTNINGVVVDTVREVMDIPEGNIEPPPQYGNDVDQEFLTGMGKVGDDVIMLLDVDRIFSESEKDILESVQE